MSNTAVAASLYMDRSMEPHVQALVHSDRLAPASRQALAKPIRERDVNQHIAAIKVWRLGRAIVHRNREPLIGTKLPLGKSVSQTPKQGRIESLGDIMTIEAAERRAKQSSQKHALAKAGMVFPILGKNAA